MGAHKRHKQSKCVRGVANGLRVVGWVCLLGGGSDNTLLAMIADALLFLWLLSEKFVFIAVTKIKIA